MKKILFIIIATMALSSCYDNNEVYLTFSADGQTMCMENSNEHTRPDSMPYFSYCTTVEVVGKLLQHSDEELVVEYDKTKQKFLPSYEFAVLPETNGKPIDYSPLVKEMVAQKLVVIDTTYEPALCIIVADSAVMEAYNVEEEESTKAYQVKHNLKAISDKIRSAQMRPVLAPSGSEGEKAIIYNSNYIMSYEDTDEFLSKRGLAIIPDPEGRQVMVLHVNRHKGRY